MLVPELGWGQILTFEFAGIAGNESSYNSNSNDANLTNSTITRGAGLTASSNADRFNATNWALTSIANAVTGNNYMQFIITPNSGYQFSVSSIVISLQRSGTGPSAVALRNSVDAYATDLDAIKTITDNTNTQTFTFTFTQNNSSSAITYRVYMYAEATGGSGGIGDFSGNDIIVNGIVTSSNGTPTVTTQAVSSIETTTATGNGTISATGGDNATARGICWDIYANPDPDLSDSHSTESGSFGTGAFSGSITNVSAETRYKAVAYATNPTGTGYGTAVNFWTLSLEPATHTTTFTNSVVSQTQIDLTFDAANTITDADGYVILQKTGSAPTGIPTDGNAYSVGNTIGDGTVAAIVTSSSATASSIGSLSAGTSYYFTITPYNYNGANSETYNYKADGTIPGTNGTTSPPNDADSYVDAPGSQANPGTISSLADTDPESIEGFKFKINDVGTDGLLTKVTQIKIVAGTNNNADWSSTIQGVKLSTDGGSSFVTTGSVTITASSIVFPVTVGNLNITNGSNSTISLFFFLKSSGLTDNQVLEFTIPTSSHGFTADATGSTFLTTFASATTSNQITIDVVASELNFVQQPTNVGTTLNISPAVTVSANDANGNRDLNYSTNVTITANGATLNGSPVSSAPSGGLATFSTLSFNAAATGVTLDAASGSITGETSTSFNVILIPNTGELIINQFSPDYNGATNEYIELLNKSNKTFDLSQLEIEYQSAAGGTGSAGGQLTGSIGPYQYWLLSPDATITVGLTSGLSRDGSIVSGFAGTSGQFALQLKNPPNTIIDGLAYGTITVNNLGEGTPASSPTTDGGLVRAVDGVDNGDNSTDFTTVANANIYLRNQNSYNYSSTYTLPSTSYSSDVVISGSSTAAALSGNTTISGKLIILAGALTVASGQNLTVSGTLTNSAGNSGLVIESDATSTGSLIHNTAGVDGTVERYIAMYTGIGDQMYHFLSSPVATQPIQTVFVTDPPTAGHDFYSFDEVNNLWINTKAENGTWNSSFENNFTVGKGYMVAYNTDVTKNFTGVLNNYATGTPLVLTCSNTTGQGNGWNLLGNPFPSAIDWTLVSLGDGMDDALYYYDAVAENYRYYIQLAGESGSLGSGSRYIPAMQGFMVHAKTTGTKTVSIDNGDRVHNGQNVYYKSVMSVPGSLSLTVSCDNYEDAMFLHFNSNATTGFDGKFDAFKLMSYNEKVPQIYTIGSDDTRLAINGLPGMSETLQIPVYFKAGVLGQQVITADVSQANATVYLTDIKTSVTQNLRINPTYAFTSQEGDATNRFMLRFAGVGINDSRIPHPVSVYTTGNTITILGNDGTLLTGNVFIYNLMGQQLMQQQLTGSNMTKISMDATTGYYLIKVITSDHAYSAKVFINR